MIGAYEIRRRFGYHKATPTKVPLYENNRNKVIELADFLDFWLPDGREKALAMTALQETLMWANAAVATHADAE